MTFTITRAKMLAIVGVLALLIPAAAYASHDFDDVEDGHFYHDASSWAADNGITLGCVLDGSLFCGENPVTRGENITFAHRYDTNVVQPALDDINDAVDDNADDITDNTEALAAGYYHEPNGGIVTFNTAGVTVGVLELPAGNYIVNAALVANSNSGSDQDIGCELRLDATVIDYMHDSLSFPLDQNEASGSRESIALTGGGTLAADGTASVECDSETNSGNYLGLTITAIRVSEITETTAPT